MTKIRHPLLILTCTVLLLNPLSGYANNVPLAQDDITATNEDTPVNIDILWDNGSGADSFGDDGPHSGRIMLPVNVSSQGGTLSVNDAGTPDDPTDDTVDYMPARHFNGTDNFEYVLTDSNGDSDTASVRIDVAAINDVPVANDDISNTRPNTPVNLQPLSNDDFGGDGRSNYPIIIITPPDNGSAAVNTNGTTNNPLDDTIDYLPAAGFSGTDRLTYRLCDADNNCAEAGINIEVSDNNAVPTAQNDTINIDEVQTLNIAVLEDNGNGADSFGDDGPNKGNISLPEVLSAHGGVLRIDDGRTADDPRDDRVHYIPPANFSDSDSFTYAITDANGDTSTATVTLVLRPGPGGVQHSANKIPTASTWGLIILSILLSIATLSGRPFKRR